MRSHDAPASRTLLKVAAAAIFLLVRVDPLHHGRVFFAICAPSSRAVVYLVFNEAEAEVSG